MPEEFSSHPRRLRRAAGAFIAGLGAVRVDLGVLLAIGSGAIAAWAVARGGVGLAPIAIVPLYLTYQSYARVRGLDAERRQVQQTADVHRATVDALAGAIDAKDPLTQRHLHRLQVYATSLASRLGLPAIEIQGLRTATLLHDIGTLAVPEHILSKPGPLTEEEFQKVRIHPRVGAEILAAVPFPSPVAPLILSHHERWDGTGYPQGLAGEDIPLGARILTLVDYYDAVTTARPYHPALSHESAVELLRHESGRALDPSLVPIFLELLPGLRAQLGPPAPAPAPPPRGSAFEAIAHAHREISALYDFAQSLGTSLGVADTMALLSAKLSPMVAWSGCALFLTGPDRRSLTCRFAAGIDAPQLLHTTLPEDHMWGVVVTHARRTQIDRHPQASFSSAGLSGAHTLQAAILCPLLHQDTVIGCLALFHVQAHYYNEDHRRLLARIAEQAGAVIHNALVFEQTQAESLTDALTGLPNRRSMAGHLTRALARADRLQSEVALLVLDIDGFKAINDTHGHRIGDQALRAVATALQGTLRPYDLCVRYAGDEFIVVLADCSREGAETKRRECQARISALQLDGLAGARIRLGVSAGAAVFPHDGRTYDELLADADHMMYRDKAARRRHAARVIQVPGAGASPDRFDAALPLHPTGPLPQTVA